MGQAPIGYLDADCFYVSAERVRYDHLAGLPVGVLGNQGACVIARSYEMKASGIRAGTPIWEALTRCPEGVYVKRDFRWYEVLSRMMLDVVRDFSPKVEYFSIDEFFFEATPPPGKDYEEYARLIQGRILERVRVPVTVGIGRTRTLAKLIGEVAKPFGASAILDRAAEEALLAAQPVSEISGIAGRRERRLLPWNIRSCLDLAQADRRLVRELLTASGEALWWELRGEPVLPIRARRPLHKVLSRGGSMGKPTDRPADLFAWLVRHLERLIEELRFHGVRPGRIAVSVGYRDGRWGEGRANLLAPSDRFDVLLDALRPCLRRAWIPYATANRMHLFAEHLSPRDGTQLGLFDSDGDRQELLARMKSAVNRQFGQSALRSAATLPLDWVYQDGCNAYDIGDVRGKFCF